MLGVKFVLQNRRVGAGLLIWIPSAGAFLPSALELSLGFTGSSCCRGEGGVALYLAGPAPPLIALRLVSSNVGVLQSHGSPALRAVMDNGGF